MQELSNEEKYVRDELEKIYPQLLINERKILGSNYDSQKGDVMHIAIEAFLSKPLAQQLYTIEIGKLENFITFIANVQAKNSTTRHYNQFRKFQMFTREILDVDIKKLEVPEDLNQDDNEQELWDCIHSFIDQLNPFERMIVYEKWMQDVTYKDLSIRYDISVQALQYHAEALKNKIKERCKHYHSLVI